jgi:hypothetical protein
MMQTFAMRKTILFNPYGSWEAGTIALQGFMEGY